MAQRALTLLGLKPGAMALQLVGLPWTGLIHLPDTHLLSLGKEEEGETE